MPALIVERLMENERTHIDLFSGIGGFALAANAAGFRTSVFCEQDDYCAGVLNRHWPSVPVIRDIREFDGSKWRGADLLTGGFPCQPFSQAGEQRGTSDDRHLWPEMFRVIKEARPRWILGENVAGIIKMALDGVCADLESENYTVQSLDIPACSVNAPHRRHRLWIVAHSNIKGLEGHPRNESCERERERERGWINCQGWSSGLMANSYRFREQVPATGNKPTKQMSRSTRKDMDEKYIRDPKGILRRVEPRICGVAHGIPHRTHRLKALGNAIVPQVAYEIIRLMDNGD